MQQGAVRLGLAAAAVACLPLLLVRAAPEPAAGKGDGGNLIHEQADAVKRMIVKSCANRYSVACLKMDVVALMDRMAEAPELQVLPGVSLVRDNDTSASAESARRSSAELVAALAKEYPQDVDARVDAFLASRVGSFVSSRSFNVRLLDLVTSGYRLFGDSRDTSVQGRGDGGGFGGGDKKGGGAGIIMMMGMMKAMMMAMGMAGVAGIAGKALMVGLMALTLSAVIGLKGMTEGGQKTTYEIVSKPVYSHEHTHSHEVQHGHGYGHSGYGRSFDEAAAGARGGRGLEPVTPAGGPVSTPAVTPFTARDAHDLAYNGYLRPQGPVS